MIKPTNSSLIGIFILGAVLLLFGSIVAFSSFSFNKKTYQFITYITDSVNGLSANSDVKFRGVKIGSVKEIRLAIGNTDVKSSSVSIPVVIEIDKKFITNDFTITDESINERLKIAIENGLRSRVQQSNILTGLLYIDIDYFPDHPAVFRNKKQTVLAEIPSIPSNLTQLVNSISTILNNLAEIDFKGIADQLQETVAKLDNGIGTIEFQKINDNVVSATDSASKILSDPELSSAIKNINALVLNLDSLSKEISGNVDPLSNEFIQTAESLRKTLDEINETAQLFQNLAYAKQDSLGQELESAVEQINDTARAVRALAEYLQRNPNSVLTGKPKEEHE